jgi:hypothetical protein
MPLSHDEVWKAYYEPLSQGLARQKSYAEKYENYYDGKHPLSFATAKYKDEFIDLLRAINDNWMPIVVDAVAERMHVEGFRFGEGTKGDLEARDIWQANGLDAESEILHTSTLTRGIGYVMVWGRQDRATGTDLPLITVEDSYQVYVKPGDRRRLSTAGIKQWIDDWGAERVNIYLPDAVYKWKTKGGKAEPFAEEGEPLVLPNPLGIVPIIPFYNRPMVKPGTYRSELHDVISTQDQINKILCDAVVASEFAAFRQRWATGIEVELDENGKPKNPFESAQNRVWIGPDPESRFGTFEATELDNYTKFIENRVQSIASRSRTPPHYLLGQSGSFPSGESLKATETGLIAKTKSRMTRYGESWEEVIRLAFRVKGDSARGADFGCETIWQDPESRTEAEHIDALLKLRTLQVPYRQLWEDAGYSQSQIERFADFLIEEKLNEFLSNTGRAANGSSNGSVGESGSGSSSEADAFS